MFQMTVHEMCDLLTACSAQQACRAVQWLSGFGADPARTTPAETSCWNSRTAPVTLKYHIIVTPGVVSAVVCKLQFQRSVVKHHMQTCRLSCCCCCCCNLPHPFDNTQNVPAASPTKHPSSAPSAASSHPPGAGNAAGCRDAASAAMPLTQVYWCTTTLHGAEAGRPLLRVNPSDAHTASREIRKQMGCRAAAILFDCLAMRSFVVCP